MAGSIVEAIRTTQPHETEYLRRYDQAKIRIEAFLDLQGAKLDLMMAFLLQNRGRFS